MALSPALGALLTVAGGYSVLWRMNSGFWWWQFLLAPSCENPPCLQVLDDPPVETVMAADVVGSGITFVGPGETLPIDGAVSLGPVALVPVHNPTRDQLHVQTIMRLVDASTGESWVELLGPQGSFVHQEIADHGVGVGVAPDGQGLSVKPLDQGFLAFVIALDGPLNFPAFWSDVAPSSWIFELELLEVSTRDSQVGDRLGQWSWNFSTSLGQTAGVGRASNQVLLLKR